MTTLSTIKVQTRGTTDWQDITREVQKAVSSSEVKEGICVVFVPHTTAAVTINENADSDVPRDLDLALNKISPNLREFRHGEGNSAAHTKCSLISPSLTIIVTDGRLLLGTWQGIWFTEFDGPRNRNVHIRVLGE